MVGLLGTLDQIRNSYTIALIGEPQTGKTSLQNSLMGLPFGETVTTVGANFTSTTLDGEKSIFKLKVCDVAGQESYIQIRKNFMRQSDGAILVFDLTAKNTFLKLTSWIKEFCVSSKSKTTPLLIVGNKLDLSHQRVISLKDVQSLLMLVREYPEVEGRIIGYAETSAKTGENVRSSFRNLTSIISSAG